MSGNIGTSKTYKKSLLEGKSLPSISYGASLFAEYRINEKIWMNFGLNYHMRGLSYDSVFNSMVYHDDSQFERIQKHFVGIPLKFYYTPFSNKRGAIFIGAEVELNVLLFSKYEYKSTFTGAPQTIKAFLPDVGYDYWFHPYFTLSIGGDVKMKNFNIRIEPYFSTSMRGFMVDDPFNELMYDTGLKLSFVNLFKVKADEKSMD